MNLKILILKNQAFYNFCNQELLTSSKQPLGMIVGIPSLDKNPNLESPISDCPKNAHSIFVINLMTEESSTIHVEHDYSEVCKNIPKLVAAGITDFVSGICCQDHFDKFHEHKIEVWKCNATTIRDMINNFKIGGASVRKWGDVMTHVTTK